MIYYVNGKNKYSLLNDEVKDMANTMSDAFINHSNWIKVIKNEKKRKKALYNLFLVMFKVINKYGHIVITNDYGKNIGYITFMDNKDKEQVSINRIIKVNALHNAIKFLTSLSISQLIKMNNFEKVVMSFYDGNNDDNKVIHLYSTGIAPKYKGKGYMGEAFRYSYNLFKELGYESISLETTDASNLPIYKRLGFEKISERDITDQRIYFMNNNL